MDKIYKASGEDRYDWKTFGNFNYENSVYRYFYLYMLRIIKLNI